jgi:tRNA-dihydrouridine synthase A
MATTAKIGISSAKDGAGIDRRLSVAPMMAWSDRHCRYFLRLLAPGALLYTEMVVAEAILRGDAARLLEFDPAEHPVALQLGGADPARLASAARRGAEAGYDEINLNVGCPSDRVQNATFGACLMAQPARVGECIAALRAAVSLPVTVKCRIGIDAHDSYEFLRGFVEVVASAGCDTFIVHARKAVLSGLSPKQNREVPPLRPELVWRLKAERPDLSIVINGGIRTLAAAAQHWAHVDGVMIGREAYHNPYFLAELDRAARARPGEAPPAQAPSPASVVAALAPYVAREVARGTPLQAITRHLLGLYTGRPGARSWRRVLSELGRRPAAGVAVLEAARTAAESVHGAFAANGL